MSTVTISVDETAGSFEMDCEFERAPEQQLQDEIIQAVKGKKKGRKRSKFAQVVAKKKPVFDPGDHTFDEYVEEYYKLDFEDIIGDLPCRFKYRNVVANTFGLSIEEILKADEKELNRWCSLKKAVQFRPEHVEKYDVQAYQRKAMNEHLKKKTFQSIYGMQSEQNETGKADSEEQAENTSIKKKKKKSKKRKLEGENNVDNIVNGSKLKKSKQEDDDQNAQDKSTSADYVSSVFSASEKSASKTKVQEQPNSNAASASGTLLSVVGVKTNTPNKKKNKKKKKNPVDPTHVKEFPRKERHLNGNYAKKAGKKQNDQRTEQITTISDARLRAYGINPKKYKNKLKYGKKLS